jgi:hypothetical protein
MRDLTHQATRSGRVSDCHSHKAIDPTKMRFQPSKFELVDSTKGKKLDEAILEPKSARQCVSWWNCVLRSQSGRRFAAASTPRFGSAITLSYGASGWNNAQRVPAGLGDWKTADVRAIVELGLGNRNRCASIPNEIVG